MLPPSMNDRRDLWRYAGLSTQILVGLGLFLLGGRQLDHWAAFRTPLFTWLLPLLFITGLIVRLIVETGRKKNRP